MPRPTGLNVEFSDCRHFVKCWIRTKPCRNGFIIRLYRIARIKLWSVMKTFIHRKYGRYRQDTDMYKRQKQNNAVAAIQGGPKKRGHRLMTIILSNLNDLQNFFTGRFLGKFAVKLILNIPPHLAYVATQPCETLVSAKQAISSSFSSVLARCAKCMRQPRCCL